MHQYEGDIVSSETSIFLIYFFIGAIVLIRFVPTFYACVKSGEIPTKGDKPNLSRNYKPLLYWYLMGIMTFGMVGITFVTIDFAVEVIKEFVISNR